MRPAVLLAVLLLAPAVPATESIWIEAEHFDGVRGHCWPMGKAEQRTTDGRWGLSGPGWAAEWTQGGESGFLSIACGPDDDKATVSTAVTVPEAGRWFLWVRFRDAREASARFEVGITQPDAKPWTGSYGTKPIIEEDNELKLYWGWAFAWEAHPVELKRGAATLTLRSAVKADDCRQIDCVALTTDPAYRPRTKERPAHPSRALLDEYRKGLPAGLEPLARRAGPVSVPEGWKPRTVRDEGFLYLWNMGALKWAGDDPKRVPVPYHVGDKPALEAFEKRYAGRADVPIFGDRRIVPTFLGTGPAVALQTDAKDATAKADAANVQRWLDADPKRRWASLLNYQPDSPLTEAGRAAFFKQREKFVGRIAGESLGYFEPDAKELEAAKAAKTRREFAAAFGRAAMKGNDAKWRAVFGPDFAKLGNAYAETIPCQSVEGTAFYPLCYEWGARTVGHESSAITGSVLGMRLAFLRGAARQYGGTTATYRSCNFGDAATIFTEQSTYSKPTNILDNFYSVYSGAGMTWYKMDLWHQYMSGSGLFYHEQGFDEFWMPGGTSYGPRDVQLSPKGKLVDRFLRVTAKHPDRGTPITPIAFLVDHAHGWDPSAYEPAAFGATGRWRGSDVAKPGDHERMLEEYFWTAYHPIGAKAEQPTTATSEVYVPGVFGDIFDVVYATPDVKRWANLETYPVVIVAGDIDLTAAEGERLSAYIDAGGTLLLADGQLTGPGVAALKLPERGAPAEATAYRIGDKDRPAQRFAYRPLTGGVPLATAEGKAVCAAYDRGKGRLVVLGVPRGLGMDRRAVPLVGELFARLTCGLMPVEVDGDVEWLVNRTATGYTVTLLNPAGQDKPQQGVFPTDHRQAREVTIRAKVPVTTASDWLAETETLAVNDGRVTLSVPAGGVRVVELK